MDGQMFSVTATPQGFLAVGPSGGRGCLGGMWTSSDGSTWQCDASDARFKEFGPYAAAASGTVVVAVGLADPGTDDSGAPTGAAWSRTLH
jgi:hypothetical protein